MPAPIFPAGVKTLGNTKVVYVATIATPTAPKLTESGAATSLDVSKMLYAGGWQPAVEAGKVTPPPRLGSKIQYESFGISTRSLGDLRYAFSPQAASASDGKKAYEKFADGTVGWFLERLGLDVDTDLAIGQFVNVYPVLLGPQQPQGDTTDEAAEYEVVQPVSITGEAVFNVAMVA